MCRISLTPTIKVLPDDTFAQIKNELKHFKVLEGAIDYTELMRYSKCHVCNFIPTRRPVYQCQDGHKLCYKCFSEVNPCKMCYKRTLYLGIRNILFEKILDNYEKPCRWMKYGCAIKIKELNEHENNNCEYGKVRCIFIQCQEGVSISKMLEHFSVENSELHFNFSSPIEKNLGIISHVNYGSIDLPKTYGMEYSLAYPPGYNRITYLRLDDEHNFFMECFACHHDQKCYFWVYYLGLQSEAKHFGFNITLYKENSNHKIYINGPVVSITHWYMDLIQNSNDVFKIGFDEIREFWNQNTLSFLWEVSVYNTGQSAAKNIKISCIRTKKTLHSK